jgi:hypothetical protein
LNDNRVHRIMIKCPVTGNPVPTGMAMDKISFESPTNTIENNTVHCPHYGQSHKWGKKAAWLD